MAKLYLLRGREIISIIDDEDVAVTALPLMGGGETLTLINEEHLKTLALNIEVPVDRAIEKMGLTVSAEAISAMEAEVAEMGTIAPGVKSKTPRSFAGAMLNFDARQDLPASITTQPACRHV